MVIKKHQRWSLLSCLCKILQGSIVRIPCRSLEDGWTMDIVVMNERTWHHRLKLEVAERLLNLIFSLKPWWNVLECVGSIRIILDLCLYIWDPHLKYLILGVWDCTNHGLLISKPLCPLWFRGFTALIRTSVSNKLLGGLRIRSW